MPLSREDFEELRDTKLDLSPDTTQGKIYRHLLLNSDMAFRQKEIVQDVDVPGGSVGPTLRRLEEKRMVEHRGRYWAVSDQEHATASAVSLSSETLDSLDGGFSDEDVKEWMENAVEPIEK
ncbi:MAG: MarR family transcriptional regulator [Halobacteria archaeon]